MDFSSLSIFVITCLAINLIPGPDVIYIVTNTMKGRVQDGLKAAMGLGVGYVFHTAAACLGLSAIILSSALLFTVIKFFGAAYLCYLGIKCLMSMYLGQSNIGAKSKQEYKGNVFVQGIVVSVLNPKVALFFLSFLPQFIDQNSENVTWSLLIYGLTFCCLATLCNLVYAVAGGWVFSKAKSTRYTRILEGVSGVMLIGLAGKITLDGR
ncbi:LysE family translocator [Pseudoalteromonas luteoviolacea]|uniref:Lysine transporter LysE n=1 Tax=Pseudoalteromonas luteoviolacea S4054 TaxID=1129367 RepID=A0A0F6AEB6_9GAMM|nr:LysE family translocator [Pseudoalteromonas luteoviolacea]AOT08117.1 lysine transporter LysE [Pseudoalteromonas luteoviolacea]AOT13034.1 lysine transporter LysE [Pseudoalteromonas luteoviolacea]AOT17946.1 lysine transporter LysE [Pseudoalteromonas luteoviolacea]KKE84503.1 hypothetical protein N479_08755 [Pseudoalteromonas luteoviolacea S4054]KZN69523.1 hypothetical protein N481_22285 [Pseudoalteromonas luteoviolacea S4047-1]